jgi:hypothetical protein
MSENYDANGQFLGAAVYPQETVKYFEFSFKGNRDREDTCFYVLPLLAEHLRDNHPELKVLDLENRMLNDKQVIARARQSCAHFRLALADPPHRALGTPLGHRHCPSSRRSRATPR